MITPINFGKIDKRENAIEGKNMPHITESKNPTYTNSPIEDSVDILGTYGKAGIYQKTNRGEKKVNIKLLEGKELQESIRKSLEEEIEESKTKYEEAKKAFSKGEISQEELEVAKFRYEQAYYLLCQYRDVLEKLAHKPVMPKSIQDADDFIV